MAVPLTQTLRSQQKAEVRASILEAIVRLIAEGGLEDLSFARVARGAGVSERTVYRYFPNRPALLEALSEWAREQVGEADPPADAHELGDSTRRAFNYFEENEPLTRALLLTDAGAEIREVSRKRRLKQLDKTLGPALKAADPAVARRAAAVIALLYSAKTWQVLREESGLSSTEAGEAAAWAIETLLAAAQSTTNKEKK
jgi:AcrR family transcriptional regulator